MIRVVLPQHLRTLAKVQGEVQLEFEGPVTQRAVLDALEDKYPMLQGTIRDHVTKQRRAFLRHSSFRVGETSVLATDAECSGHPAFQGFSLCLTPGSAADAEKLFGALAKSGKVKIPLSKTFFSPCFGEVSDRFGVNWMFYVAP
jgi:uncharacterized glyoxalase superfamily protein PhnB